VKPAYEYCSNGITNDAVVLNPEELEKQIAFVLSVYHQPALDKCEYLRLIQTALQAYVESPVRRAVGQ
jgi:hypothetical protein